MMLCTRDNVFYVTTQILVENCSQLFFKPAAATSSRGLAGSSAESCGALFVVIRPTSGRPGLDRELFLAGDVLADDDALVGEPAALVAPLLGAAAVDVGASAEELA